MNFLKPEALCLFTPVVDYLLSSPTLLENNQLFIDLALGILYSDFGSNFLICLNG